MDFPCRYIWLSLVSHFNLLMEIASAPLGDAEDVFVKKAAESSVIADPIGESL